MGNAIEPPFSGPSPSVAPSYREWELRREGEWVRDNGKTEVERLLGEHLLEVLDELKRVRERS